MVRLMTDILIPTSLPYPEIYNLNDVNALRGKFCYVIEKYPLSGVSITIVRKDGNVCVQMADFLGKTINPDNINENYEGCIDIIMTTLVPRLIVTMKLSGIKQSLYYFANCKDPILVDVRVSLNKFCGPGFVFDIFGRQGIPTQKKIGDPLNLDEEGLKTIKKGKGIYSGGKFIIKPSAFKTMIRGENILPLYGILTNEAQPSP